MKAAAQGKYAWGPAMSKNYMEELFIILKGRVTQLSKKKKVVEDLTIYSGRLGN